VTKNVTFIKLILIIRSGLIYVFLQLFIYQLIWMINFIYHNQNLESCTSILYPTDNEE